MQKSLLCFAICAFTFTLLRGQTYFSKLLETPFPYIGAVLGGIEAPDSGFILMHTSFDVFQDTNKINIVKIDKTGQIVWTKSYGAAGTAHDQLEIIRTKDSCYVFCGGEWKNDVYSAFLFKINETGDSIWMKTYNDSFYFGFFNKIVETSGKDLICIGGFDKTPPNGSSPWRQIYVVKTDKDGNMQWQKNYGSGDLNDNGRDIVETPDKGFICSGYVGYPYVTSDFFVRGLAMKIDSLGQVKWIKNYPSNEYHQAFIEINQTLDGNYLLTGESTNNRYVLMSDPNGTGGILLKIDAEGNTLWFKRYNDEINDAGCYDFVELPDSSIVTIGIRYQLKERATLVKFNSQGDIIWTQPYLYNTEFETNENLFKVIHTKDNGFLMTGYAHNPMLDTTGFSIGKGWILKVDSLGCPTPMCVTSTIDPIKETNKEIKIYPNPFRSEFQIELPTEKKYNKINIYDLAGRLVFSLGLTINEYQLTIDGSKMDNGVYFIEFVSDDQRISKKIIKIE